MGEKLYLGELIKRDEVEFEGNNLIKSPVGSGKTYLINDLSEQYEGKKLMLVSITALKDKVGSEEGKYTTQKLRKEKLKVSDKDIYVMTYAEFGEKVKWSRDFLREFSVVFCDEIHSLFDYYFIGRSLGLASAIAALFEQYEDIRFFYFTATTHELDRFIDKEYNDLYRNVKVVNYYESDEIVRYLAYFTKEFTGLHEIENVILEISGLKHSGKKGVIYNDRIDGMEAIEKLLKYKDLNAISIWSVNNADKPMTSEQLRVREFLLNEERIPDEYDFIIINGAMREGWDLKDPDVEFVVLNTLNKTSEEQALGRVRKNVALLYKRADDNSTSLSIKVMNKEKSLGLIESLLGKPIDKETRVVIEETFNIRREEDGRLYKWQTISRVLSENGYSVEVKRVRENGKQKTVHYVSRVRQNTTPSMASRSTNFIKALESLGFSEVNKAFIDSYIRNSRDIAFAHIRAGHERFVSFEGWSERKFVDVVYLLARDEKIFGSENFIEYGVEYKNKKKIEILTERAKYEKGSQKRLESLAK